MDVSLLPIGLFREHQPTAAAGSEAHAAAVMVRAAYERLGFHPPWIGYLALSGEQIVGVGAFQGPPHTAGIEITHWIFPQFQRRGIGTAVARALRDVARAAAPAMRVFARTPPGESPSSSALRNAGFQLAKVVEVPENGSVLEWEVLPPPANCPSLVLREESDGDRNAIREVTRIAFEASGHGHHGEAALVERLRDGGGLTLSLVAERDGQILGHLCVSPINLPTTTPVATGVGLGPLSVLPDWRRRGIASALVHEGLQRLSPAHGKWVVVLGDPAYYRRFGFLPASEFGLSCPFEGVPAEAFQAMPINGGYDRRAAGAVHYRPEFSELCD